MFERPCGIANTGTVECHFGDLIFDAEFTVLTGISKQKHAVTVTTAIPITLFRFLPMKINLRRLTTGTMTVAVVMRKHKK